MFELITKAILIGSCALAWRAGGSAEFPKGVRRYGCAGLILISTLFNFSWLSLLSLPLLIGSFSLGYGVNSTLIRIFKNKFVVRAICGLAYSLAATPILWGNWYALGFHVALCTSGVMLAGNQKFEYSDLREEFFIGLIVGIMPILG